MLTRRLVVWIVLLGLLSLVATRTLIASDQEPLSPHVLGVEPFPGSEIRPEDPLVFVFDQPMLPESLTLSFEPSLTGQVTWIDPEQVMFRPDGDRWAADQQYRVTLMAQAANQLMLEDPFQTVIQTRRSLVVTSVTPERDATNIDVRSPITISFDRPMIPLSSTQEQDELPSPLRFEPALEGTGEWVNSSVYRFTPTGEKLASNTLYIITVLPDIAAVDGAAFTHPYTWSFRTAAPTISYIGWNENDDPTTTVVKQINDSYWAGRNALTAGVGVVFNQPMEHSTTEEAFVLQNAAGVTLSGSFRWTDDSTIMTFQPNERLDPEQTYKASVAAAAQSLYGEAVLAAPVTQDLQTVARPFVTEVTPTDDVLLWKAGQASILIKFNNDMDRDSFDGHYTISPPPKGRVKENTYSYYRGLQLSFIHETNTTYTITILPGILDQFGTVLTEPYSFSYNVRPPTPEDRSALEPVLNGSFVELGLYQNKPMLGVRVTGRTDLTLDIYRAELDQVMAIEGNWPSGYPNLYYDDDPATEYILEVRVLPWREPDRLVNSTTQTLQAQGEDRQEQWVWLTQDNGQRLPLGLYGVDIASPELDEDYWLSGRFNGEIDHRAFVLAVTNAAVTLKVSQTETHVWVTDYVTTKPLPGAPVRLYIGSELWHTGLTDENGFLSISDTPPPAPPDPDTPYYEDTRRLYAVVEDTNLFGIWQSGLANEYYRTTKTGYLYTDRPIYRPGETVYFRGMIRDVDDMTFTVPDVSTISLILDDENGRAETIQVPVSEIGTFSGSVTLPSELNSNYTRWFTLNATTDADCYTYQCKNYGASVRFEVTIFRPPEFEVKIASARPAYRAGDALDVNVEAMFYSGSPVSDAKVTWSIYGDPTGFAYRGDERGYQFFPTVREFFYSDSSVSVTPEPEATPVATDMTGHAHLDGTLIGGKIGPTRALVSATVTGQSGEGSEASTSILIHPANVYVGLKTDDKYGVTGQRMVVDLLAVSPESEPRAQQEIEIRVIEKRLVMNEETGYHEMQEVDFETVVMTTDEQGHAQYAFVPPYAGAYEVHTKAVDEDGHDSINAIDVYAIKPDTLEDSFLDPYGMDQYNDCDPQVPERIRLSADQSHYRPGDVANILIVNPLGGTVNALITVERQGILMRDITTIDGTLATYALPITSAYAPNIYVNVLLLQGVDAAHPAPRYTRGQLRLTVEPTDRYLNVTLTPSAEQLAPGETLTVDVTVTDWQGRPVSADVGVALTDEAVLALRPPNASPITSVFYFLRNLNVSTSTSLSALLTAPTGRCSGGGGGGGDGGETTPLVRDNYIYTPLWTSVMTDNQGKATVSVVIPDNLTRWRIDARAITVDADTGQAVANVTSQLPLVVRPVTPRAAIVGDHLALSATVANNTQAAQITAVTLQAPGFSLDESTPSTQTITLEAGQQVRVDWWGTIEDVDAIDIVIEATADSGLRDAARPVLGPLKVVRYIAPDVVATAGVLSEQGSLTEGIRLPTDVTPYAGALTVDVNSSLTSASVDSLILFSKIEEKNIEAVASRLYSYAVVYRTLKLAGSLSPDQATAMRDVIQGSITLLYQGQSPSKDGWGWWRETAVQNDVTAYALLALREAENAGFAIDHLLISKAVESVKHSVTLRLDANTSAWTLNEQALLVYTLSLYHPSDLVQQILDKLFLQRLRMSSAGRAYLLLGYGELAPDAQAINTLRSDLMGRAIVNARGTYWESEVADWQQWGSHTRTTSLVLIALLHTASETDNPVLANAVRWLISARHGETWASTQDTAWASHALMLWAETTHELEGDYDYTLMLNDTLLLKGEVLPNTDKRVEASADLAALQTDEINRLTIMRGDGPGTLYYTAMLALQLPAADLEAQNRGVLIERAYFLDGTQQPITQAHIGDVINIRLTVTVGQDIPYFVLSDTLPGGLDIKLPKRGGGRTLNDWLYQPRDDEAFWSWGTWIFTSIGLRDDGVTLYAGTLPRGTYTYSYQAQAMTPGEFQILPATGAAMYQAEIFGRTQGGIFSITQTD